MSKLAKDITRMENCKSIPLMQIDANILTKIYANESSGLYIMTKGDLFQKCRWFNA